MNLNLIATIVERLAQTQANLPVPLTPGERTALRDAAVVLLRLAAMQQTLQRVINGD